MALSLKAAAAKLGVHPETLRLRAREFGVKFGRKWLFPDDIEQQILRREECHIDAKILVNSTSVSQEYAALLGLTTGTTRQRSKLG